MRRRLGWLAIAWLLIVCAAALAAYGAPTVHASLDERVHDLAGQLRCLVCAGESVADSPSGFAQGVRLSIRRQLLHRRTDEQIRNYFVSRYGQRILLSPPASGIGSIAWLAPPLLVLGGIGLVVTLVTDWRTNLRKTPTARDVYLQRVRAELAAERSEH